MVVCLRLITPLPHLLLEGAAPAVANIYGNYDHSRMVRTQTLTTHDDQRIKSMTHPHAHTHPHIVKYIHSTRSTQSHIDGGRQMGVCDVCLFVCGQSIKRLSDEMWIVEFVF